MGENTWDNSHLTLWNGDYVKLVWSDGAVRYDIIQFDEYKSRWPFLIKYGVFVNDRNAFKVFRITKEEYMIGKALEALS